MIVYNIMIPQLEDDGHSAARRVNDIREIHYSPYERTYCVQCRKQTTGYSVRGILLL